LPKANVMPEQKTEFHSIFLMENRCRTTDWRGLSQIFPAMGKVNNFIWQWEISHELTQMKHG